VDTPVKTQTRQVGVAATTDLVSTTGTLLPTASASGQSQQALWMDVSL